MDNKAHLLYMTGLSVDKARMNNITKNIIFDKDFTYWLSTLQNKMSNILSPYNQKGQTFKGFTRSILKSFIGGNMGTYTNVISNCDTKTIDNMQDAEVANKTTNILDKYLIEPTINKVFSPFIYDDKIITQNNDYLFNLMKKYSENLSTYKNNDFFSFYMSNQSDSIGIQTLSKISDEFNFNLEHSYCDMPYYDNKFVDHVILELDTTTLPSNYEEVIINTFNLHVYDILLSRIIQEYSIESTSDNKTKGILSFADLVLQDNNKISNKDIIKTLSDRNLFGINLLSQILFTIQSLTKSEIEEINIKDEINSTEYNYLQELLQMSSSTHTKINPNKEDREVLLSAKIYFSDGIKLSKNIDNLCNDDFFKYTNKYNDNDQDTLKNGEGNREKLEEYINAYSSKTINNQINDENKIHYIKTINKKVYIKVPIKMMMSLPVDEDGKANSNIDLPFCLIDKNEKNIDVLTVGGAEHNRALAHLVNKHRLKYKEERLFGFMDNYFDFGHKMILDGKGNHQSSFNFFMGINQPVSGWNYILDKRVDDEDGNSINSDVKFITFKIKNQEQTINVVSIYGFSARSSVLGVNMFISELIDKGL